MSIPRHLIFASLVLFLGACDSEPTATPADEAPAEQALDQITDAPPEAADNEQPTLATDLEPGETRHFGAPFTLEEEPLALHELLADLIDDQDFQETAEPVKVSAQIHQVCQKKGCWFTLTTDAVEIPVRVRMKDYGFFVSRNSDGAQAIVEGTLARTTISQEMAQHYADDLAATSGEEAEKVEGDQDSFEFTATAITISHS